MNEDLLFRVIKTQQLENRFKLTKTEVKQADLSKGQKIKISFPLPLAPKALKSV